MAVEVVVVVTSVGRCINSYKFVNCIEISRILACSSEFEIPLPSGVV